METSVHRPDQIVVALSHLDLVRETLANPQFGFAEADLVAGTQASSDLGLALINLPGQFGPLDGLLADLREHFRARLDGWTATIGKNRVVGNVGAKHVIGGGGAGAPRRVVADDSHVIGGGGSGVPRRVAAQASAGARPGDGARASGARVTVADTAIFAHPVLAGGFLAGADSLLPSTGPVRLPYPAGHATFVTDLVRRNAPGATVHVQRVLDDEALADSWDLAVAVVAAVRAGTDVLNLSLGCFTDDDRPPLVLAAMLRRLGPSVVVVAAAGNHGADGRSRRPLWPAAFDSVVAVGAASADGKPAPFHPDAPWVDIMAPGVDVVSAYLDDRFDVLVPRGDDTEEVLHFGGQASWSGSSFAAGLVCGLIAERIDPGRVDAPSAYQSLRREVAAGTVEAWLPPPAGYRSRAGE